MSSHHFTTVLIVWFITGSLSLVFAQDYALTGKVVDSWDQSPLAGANVLLRSQSDSTYQRGAITDLDGHFLWEKLLPGSYLLRISFVGYTPLTRSVKLDERQKDLGMLKLEENPALLKEVTVEGVRSRAEQIGDTTQYNADAYQTNPDANAEDLIRKMPGITLENGTVKAQGEDVKKVLVDGNEFFADDPNLALKNLPAEVIDKVQVYDEMSDQSKFTGFDDGNAAKTINIITKPGKSNGQFGKVYAGYGTDQRYLGGGSVNFFNGSQRISVIGLTNNINQQNFSTQDLMGVVGGNSQRGGGRGGRGGGRGGRGGRGGGGDVSDFLIGQQGGISRTNAFGLNFSDTWGSKLKVTGSYFFNGTHNNNHSLLSRNYFSEKGPGQLYEENSQASSKNLNHRLSFRLEYTLDKANSLLITPKFNLQDFRSYSTSGAATTLEGSGLLNKSQNDYNTDYFGYNFSNHILFRHRFSKSKRTLSLNIGTQYNHKRGASDLNSLNEYYQSADSLVLLDQSSDLFSDGYTLSGDLDYTEPLGEQGMLMLNYSPSYTQSSSDKKTFNLGEGHEEPGILDTTLTNRYDNLYLAQNTGIGYMLRTEKSHLMFRVNYQYAVLSGTQDFPQSLEMKKSFSDLLPMAMYRHEFSNHSNLRIFYRTSTDPPSIDQLQNVIDNSNPLLLSTGNPDLKQEYSHRLIARYGLTHAENAHSFFVFLMGSYTGNYVSKATFIADQDTTLAGGVTLFRGSQLRKPVNLDGYGNVRSFLTYGLPVTPLKSNLNLNFGVSYTRTPGLINDALNVANTYNLNTGLVMSSNISEKIDFTLSYAANYNVVGNTLTPEQDNNYFSQTTGLAFNWLFGKGFVFDTDLNHTLYAGLADAYNQHYLLWNAGFGYKFLKNKRGEVKLSVFDLLNQNNSIDRTVTEAYIEDSETQVLNRFFMLTFTYNLRNFVAKETKDPGY